MEKQLRKFIRKEILKEVSTLGGIASEAGQVSVNIKGWELPPGGFKPIENVVDTLKLQLLDQQERIDHMDVYSVDKIPDTKYRKVVDKDIKYDEVHKQTTEFVKKYTNKTNDMKLIGESTMKISETKLRSLIRKEIVDLVSEVPRQFKTGKTVTLSKSFGSKDRGGSVGTRTRSKGGDTKIRSLRGKKAGGGKSPEGRTWKGRPQVGGKGEYGTFGDTLRDGGSKRTSMKSSASSWATSEIARWKALAAQADSKRDKTASQYFDMQLDLLNEKDGINKKIRDAKWDYVDGGIAGNTAAQEAAITELKNLNTERDADIAAIANVGKGVNWDNYDVGGGKKKK